MPSRILSRFQILCFALSFAFIQFLAAPARAQFTQGSVVGTVADSSGARVPSASITVESQAPYVMRTLTANASGEFVVASLDPGEYTLTVKAKGFAPAESKVRVLVSSPISVAVVLLPEAQQQTVTVQGQASSISTQPVETTSSVEKGVVTQYDLSQIPLASRSFANIAFMVPMTEPVEPSDPTKARTTAISFGGSSGLNVDISVDGGDNNDDWIGGILQSYSPDAIQEFTVRTAGYDADTRAHQRWIHHRFHAPWRR